MTLYSDSDLPIRPALTAAHERTLASFSAPGTWWTGAQRAALVAETREARATAGLQEASESGPQQIPTDIEVPEAARRVARQVAVSTNKLDRGLWITRSRTDSATPNT